jgi:nitrate reductase (NAD(P)H)
MSQHLDTLAIGDTIDVKGPVGHFVYEGRNKFSLNRKPGSAK